MRTSGGVNKNFGTSSKRYRRWCGSPGPMDRMCSGIAAGRNMRTVDSGWQDVIDPTDLRRHWEKWCASLASGGSFENEARFRRAADGQYRWFLSRAVPLRDEYGKILKWYGISTDIEDRKRAEEEREKLRADLAHVNRVSMLESWLPLYPLGFQITPTTSDDCPVKVCNSRPVRASLILAVLSALPVNSRFPSGLQATVSTGSA